MSLLVTAVLLLSLLWSEFRTPVEDVGTYGIAVQVILISLLAPSFAAFQMWVGRKRHRKELPGHWISRFRFMVVAHMAVWVFISLTIIFVMRWPDAVRLIPGAITFPLLDDVVLIAPALISLISSWAIFVYAAPCGTLSISKSPSAIFSLWLRMRILMVLAPILFAFCVTDCLRLATQVQVSTTGVVALWSVVGLAVIASIALYPQIMLLVWNTKPLTDEDLKARFERLFRAAGLQNRKVYVWQTGRSVANAAAIGIVPGTEIIVLSDMLLEKFSDEELDAIVLHEIGHIKRRHCIKRIAMVLVPLFLLAVDQSMAWGLHAAITDSVMLNNAFGALTKFLPAIAFLVYLLIASSWLFRNMEFEADEFAIETLYRGGAGDSANSVNSALEKLAIIYPQHVNRRSGLHPSIRERMTFAIERKSEILGRERAEPANSKHATKNISLDPIALK